MALARMGGCWKTVVREAVWGPWVELGAGSCASAGSLLGGCSREASGREQLCETAGKLLGGRLLGGRLLGDCGEASFYYLMPQPAQFFGRLMCVAAQCMLLCAHCIAHRGFAYSKLLSVCGRCCSERTLFYFWELYDSPCFLVFMIILLRGAGLLWEDIACLRIVRCFCKRVAMRAIRITMLFIHSYFH